MSIRGVWYDGSTSQRHPAELHVAGGTLAVFVGGRQMTPFHPLSAVTITERLGTTPRRVDFPGGTQFQTEDNDAIDQFLRAHGRSGLLHHLESRWRYVALAVVVLGVFAFASVRYGIPAIARVAAGAVPPVLEKELDEQVVRFLDREMLADSALEVATQERLRRRFHEFQAQGVRGIKLTVLFRSAAHSIGPNALALPGGTIVVTDELVKLAENDDQLLAVYAHEAGHVSHRHALRQTLQASLLSLLVVSVSGDVSSVSSLVTTLPVTLTQLGYSRDFEHEADRAALQSLRRAGLDPEQLALILERLEAWHDCRLPRSEDAPRCKVGNDDQGLFDSYLSTHPPTEERIAFVRGDTGRR